MGDQQTRHTTVSRRSCQWPKKLFFEMIDIATLNSNIIHREVHPEYKGSRSDFLQALSEELAVDNMKDRLQSGHLPEELAEGIRNFVAQYDRKDKCNFCVRKAESSCSACKALMCGSHNEEIEFVICKPCSKAGQSSYAVFGEDNQCPMHQVLEATSIEH